MNIEGILKYQKMDENLYKAEQKLVNSAYRKKAADLAKIAKQAQARSVELENEAEKLINELAEIKEKYATTKAKADELIDKDIEQLGEEELDKIITTKGKVANNLNVLEKLLQKCAENINHILAEFNKTKKMYDEARQQYAVCKEKIDEETKLLEPEKKKFADELLKLEKDVEPKLLAEYKKRRADNIFPVVVPLENNNFCGRCRMELPKVSTSKIKETGVIVCEHCKRLVYQA
ncbi:MAG: hypothetical protein IJ817_00125 [Clostridia bacterium]|nr:hypothetical protein [Clostridia bacterium]